MVGLELATKVIVVDLEATLCSARAGSGSHYSRWIGLPLRVEGKLRPPQAFAELANGAADGEAAGSPRRLLGRKAQHAT